MTTDFDLLKWRGTHTMTFPVPYDLTPSEAEPIPWEAIKAFLLTLGAREQRWPDTLELHVTEDQTLQFEASRDKDHPEQYSWISIRCHASWNHLLGIFQRAREIEPDLVLFDPKTGLFHNPESFEPLAIARQKDGPTIAFRSRSHSGLLRARHKFSPP